ncbi:hypothetical protein CBR_g8169 [Chara braunii]|uniref:Reverse transcriptase domain-containing protein n=1 Tax=Chara braunii TaxID=69332 RepID=A0A388KLD3_CHABU|nr:hypothetical protein CBR_g8169 [Chara braunii]|eukprot:GBG70869.1 hypothetical protein CBR_g8169 [Chara braunii]
MGICNAPATFQRAMNITFQNFVNRTRLTQGMINFCVIVYMDDILVYSETYHGHAQHIEWTLGALRDIGFKIALENSDFFLSEISFPGYVVTRGGSQPDSRKVEAVKEAPVPTSLTQVRAFLGLASYYRRFIMGFAAIARPLTNLLRKDQPLSSDAECQQAFATLKDALAMTPILIRPDPSKQFILITDWQPEAIFAILAQKGNDGRKHVIEYASRTVPDERRNDSAPQGECYAVVLGIQHFHPYLYGQKFRLVTDHEPLLALKKLTNYTGMIGRWAVRLQEYDFDIVHQKTDRHGNADGLTRLHRPAKSARAPTLSYRVKENSASLLSEKKWDARWENYIELTFCLLEIQFRWSEAAPFEEGPEHPEDSVEFLIIQVWRTAEQGDLLGFLFEKVEEGNLTLITDELLVFLTQLADDLPLDILSHVDKQPGTHVLSRTLEPHLVWSRCAKIDEDNCLYPSQALYLEIDFTDLTFWDPIARQNVEQDEGAEPEEDEGSGLSGSECEGFEPEVCDAARKRARERRKRKHQEIAEGKRPAINVSSVDPSIGEPWRDPELPEEEDDGTTTEGSRSRRRRRTASGSAGQSRTVAVPSLDPAVAGPSGSFAYIDRKAAHIPSKYDGKDDVESWISSMRSYFDVLGTLPATQSPILGTNVEPVVKGFLETQAVQSGYKRIDLNKWLKATPVTTLEELLIKQYADPHAAAKARLKLDKLTLSRWTGTMHSLQQYVSKLFATPDLEMTAQSCLDVIKGTVPSTIKDRLGLGLTAYTDWFTLMRDLVKLEAQDLPGGSGSKRTTSRKRFPGSNRFSAHDLLEDDEENFADHPSLDDDQEQGCEASCSSSAHEFECVNDEESMNVFKKTAYKISNLVASPITMVRGGEPAVTEEIWRQTSG